MDDYSKQFVVNELPRSNHFPTLSSSTVFFHHHYTASCCIKTPSQC